MDNSIYSVIFLIALSAFFYAAPLIWIKDVNPATACISSVVALIVMLVYSFYIKGYSVKDVDNNIVFKMIISGIFYGLGLLCYTEAVKYNKPTLLNLQTIFIFVLSTIIAFLMLNENSNTCKLAGIATIGIGTGLLIYGN